VSLVDRLMVTGLPLVPRKVVGKVAARYVAGESLDDALRVVEDLNGKGAMATVDLLGEEVHDRAKAEAAVAEYLRIFGRIRERGLDANVSIKLTLLGLEIEESFCRDNVLRIAETAASHGNFVRIDMEDHTTHDATFRIYHHVHQRVGNIGVVLQAYMRRIHEDIQALPAEGASVRLCKGIYIEPRRVAWKSFDAVRVNFLAALERMLEQGVYAAIATHDEYLVAAALRLLRRHQVPRERYEFQMLLGVEEELRDILIERGHRIRIYVPYGADWYLYSLRRMRENPNVARHVARATLSRRGL
jgi:proline dehydrogenase